MINSEIIERLKTELPELNWKEETQEGKYKLFSSNFGRDIEVKKDCWPSAKEILYIYRGGEFIKELMSKARDFYKEEFDEDLVKKFYIEAEKPYKKHIIDLNKKLREREELFYKKNDLKEKEYEDGELFEDVEEFDLSLLKDNKILDYLIYSLKEWKRKLDIIRKGNRDEKQIIIMNYSDYYDTPDIVKDFEHTFRTEDKIIGIINTKNWDFSKEELKDAFEENSGDYINYYEVEESEISYYDIQSNLLDILSNYFPYSTEELKNFKMYITDYD